MVRMSPLIIKAIRFASKKHKYQLDDAGRPYLNHIMQVGDIISCIIDDSEVIAAAILHDTIEDTKTTEAELRIEFGDTVTNLILEVTHEGKKDEIGYYFPRLKTRDGIMIKFADRLSNMSRMHVWDKARQEHYLKRSKFWKIHPGDTNG